MGSAIGKSIKEFRKGMNEITAHKEEEEPQLPVSAKDLNKMNNTAYESETVVKTTRTEVPGTEKPVE
jgi:Sec-independent protein translocase protein TatA